MTRSLFQHSTMMQNTSHVAVPQSVRKVAVTGAWQPECELMRSQFGARARLLVVEQSL